MFGEVFRFGISSSAWRPIKVDAFESERAVNVSAGDCAAAILTHSGKVFTFGDDFIETGVLGHGDMETRIATPRLVEGLDDRVVQVSMGPWQTAAVTASGKLFVWGNYYDGILSATPVPLLDCACAVQAVAIDERSVVITDQTGAVVCVEGIDPGWKALPTYVDLDPNNMSLGAHSRLL